MAQPYVGEIRMFAGNFAPVGWMKCDGQLIPISENETLFQLIGTTYGGDGQATFALPNLQSRVPLHMGTGPDGVAYPISQQAGTESVTLTAQQIPVHNHALLVSTDSAGELSPDGSLPGNSISVDLYRQGAPVTAMSPQAITPVGGSQPHENCQPFLCVNYIISLFGIFPSQT
ncbi:phage tail protein [Sphingomonas parva]|uniref:Phage tail protein n=1 Tax=Sphingomonas parva TaxID=2555898 RepID=A0A4Y8ZS66_9SPHN|nr:tail fiber protein [Sphingomonas parva]TFI58327.1 phage tail protein [Sphingomonas parva]